MGQSTLQLYQQHCIKLILAGLQQAVGQPTSLVTDESQFRQKMLEPLWNFLPLPLRRIGRDKLRWDEYMAGVRKEAFVNQGGKLALKPDAAARLDALAARMFGAAAPVPLAKPVARPTIGATARVATRPGAVEPAIGIDLGTTYSVVAFVDATGRPVSIPNAAGDIITPSVILIEDDGPVVGKEAVLASAMEPEKVAQCVKRDMGAKMYRKKVNGESLPPEVLSSIILRALKADAQRKLGPVKKAVITVPAYFDEARRSSTMDAGKLAGLEVLDIINEPTAAAIAYGFQLGFLDSSARAVGNKPLRILVYDLGGGTFDVTIVEINGSSFRALATDGDMTLGGRDWDEWIVNFAAEQFLFQHNDDPRSHPASYQELWLSAENAKKTLSERAKATIFINHLGTRMKVELTRDQFEEGTAPLLARTQATTQIVVRQAGLSWQAIDKVLLVGGSSRMPQVARMVQELTQKPPERSVSLDEAVAHGAALYANLLTQPKGTPSANSFSVTNINSHSLGIVGVDATGRRRNQILIPKNTPLPHTVSRVFKTQKANQPNVAIHVVEGESERPEACIQLGLCTISNLPPNLPAGSPVQVSYSYLANGQLQVTGQVVGHGAAASTVFKRENSMAEEDMQLWLGYVGDENE